MKKLLVNLYQKYSFWDDHSLGRLYWLVITRILLLFILFMLAIFIESLKDGPLPVILPRHFLPIIAFSFFISVGYLFLIHKIKHLTFHIYMQSLVDVLLITSFVWVTGGGDTVYSTLYPLVIIYSVIFLGLPAGLIVAFLSGFSYGFISYVMFFDMVPPFFLREAVVSTRPVSGILVFGSIFIHLLSFLLTALLASFVVSREEKARVLLQKTEDAFAELDSLHRSIIESIHTGILTVDLHGRIQSFNRAAIDITGWSEAEALKGKIQTIIPEYASILETVEQADPMLRKERVEIDTKDKNGRPLVLGCSLYVLRGRDDAPIGHILIFQDITSIQEMKQAYEKSQKMAFIGELAAILAHEIRTPMASISGAIQLLQKTPGLGSTNERLLQIVLQGKDQLEGFIRDFLLLSRPAIGSHEDINLVAMIEGIIETVKYDRLWHEGIIFEFNFSSHLQMKANRTELRQLLTNLILNAVQAMPDGGTVTITIDEVGSDADQRWVEISVADQGDGIEEEYREKIFEPFFTTREQGTGLGLAIVMRIVSLYGGAIRVDSKVKQGTTFYIKMPRDAGVETENG